MIVIREYEEMNALRHLLRRLNGGTASRFDRYYGDVVRPGAGYPTADEARRDLTRHAEAVNRFTWVR